MYYFWTINKTREINIEAVRFRTLWKEWNHWRLKIYSWKIVLFNLKESYRRLINILRVIASRSLDYGSEERKYIFLSLMSLLCRTSSLSIQWCIQPRSAYRLFRKANHPEEPRVKCGSTECQVRPQQTSQIKTRYVILFLKSIQYSRVCFQLVYHVILSHVCLFVYYYCIYYFPLITIFIFP